MISALNRLPNGNLELTLTIPWRRVQQAFDKTLAKLGQEVEIKGFRKGKAPRPLVAQKLDQELLLKEVLKELLPEVYLEAVKEQSLHPIINPQLKVLAHEKNKDWQIQALTCELPQIVVNKGYQTQIKKALPTTKKAKLSEDEQMKQIFQALIKIFPLKVPDILIQDEVNRMLSRLIDQTSRLGLTTEQYLSSVNKTAAQLRSEYQQQAEELLKLEFILLAIADKEKISATENEVEKLIQAVPEDKSRKSLQTPEQKAYLRQLLRKRKVIDKLRHLL
jgi:FKBP-type peptidyl-prolyl cis-trans isomerase (trigger factor)